MAVFGIGGVGGFTAEALARSGVGTLDLIDDDKVCLSNINRQILAAMSTVGRYKTDVAKERLLIISGTNNGGKTTYLRAVGINQILAQAGLFVYAENAEISLCDRIFFLFPREEKAGLIPAVLPRSARTFAAR